MKLIGELNRLLERHGYVREADLDDLSRRLSVPLHRIEEVVSFYPHFRTTAPPRAEVTVCRDLSCHLADGGALCDRLRELLADTSDIEVHEVSCLGRCDRAPAAAINGVPVCGRPAEDIAAAARSPDDLAATDAGDGVGDWTIDLYADGERQPYAVYRERAQSGDDTIAATIETLKSSGLRGMGGAGFPTGRKWELVRAESATPKYVICNADESEPGTFKDRVILAELPHLVIEGMCLAAHAIGAERGWIYLRHEYGPEGLAIERALADAREQGVLGQEFDIELFISPGGYILGEETALLEALEDRRGEPRTKPPYPGQRGLWGLPTLINNVETLAMVPYILAHGAAAWKDLGVRGHDGLKFIGVSGHVERPGVFEIAMGTTVSELIEMAGGVSAGRELKGFSPGGASSQFLPAGSADVEIDFDSLAEAGTMLGSAALVVVAEGTDMLDAAHNVVRFFRNESCGKCVPCRVGTEKVVEMLEEIMAGRANGDLRALLPRLDETLRETSICGLGQVALNPLTSALRHWGDELDARLEGSS